MASTKFIVKLKPHNDKLKVALKLKKIPQVWLNPTTHSNWVFPGKLLIGAYPDPEGPYIEQLLASGVTIFATLQTTPELATFRDYLPKLPIYIQRIQLPIVDRKVTTDVEVLKFTTLLKQLMDQGEIIYVHCHGGHGRSGTIATILLHQIEGISLNKALFKVNQQHQTRIYKPEIYIPQCKCQIAQITRLC